MKGLAFLALLSALGAQTAPQVKSTKLAEKDALFAWFDSLGFQDRMAGPVVCFESWRSEEGVRKLETRIHGFQAPAAGSAFKFYLASMEIRESGGSDQVTQTLRPVEFESAMRREIALQDRYFNEDSGQLETDPEESAPWLEPVEPFVWARVARQRGDEALSDRLYQEALEIAAQNQTPLKSELEHCFSNLLMMEGLESLREGSPLPEVRNKLNLFLRHFSSAPEANDMKGYIASLDLVEKPIASGRPSQKPTERRERLRPSSSCPNNLEYSLITEPKRFRLVFTSGITAAKRCLL